MPTDRPWEGLPRDALAAWAPHLPALADEIIDAIRAEVPAYRRPLRPADHDALLAMVGRDRSSMR